MSVYYYWLVLFVFAWHLAAPALDDDTSVLAALQMQNKKNSYVLRKLTC